ncbi:putative Thiol-disulfide oxidoreductase [Nitrospira japonica]|uniref:Putative Thiol-disulfide oxidoreductase n=1 Tax=Nitrospira japonica TaxID=1325564 RepID=A0A1W1I483_9BACT|nr:TlpA disulfide reductase family protein [Nitrospira japonica]SLM47814.1 putative Thiol-disulfide oxidoreductase [Nitrospira japonica]
MFHDRILWNGLALIAGALVLAAAGLSGLAGAATSDPFAALRVTPSAARAPVMPFDLTTLDGRPVRSQDLAGKVVLLNFWATWCGPCKEEMPSLARLQTRFDSAQVQILTVTADRHPQGIRQFFDQLGISLPVLFDEDQEVSRTFMVRGLPTTVLIGPDGRVSGRAVGPRAWDSDESIALMRHLLEEHS